MTVIPTTTASVCWNENLPGDSDRHVTLRLVPRQPVCWNESLAGDSDRGQEQSNQHLPQHFGLALKVIQLAAGFGQLCRPHFLESFLKKPMGCHRG